MIMATFLSAAQCAEEPVLSGFKLSEYIEDSKSFTIEGEEAFVRPKKVGFFITPLVKIAHIRSPRITFYDAGKEISHIVADWGELNLENKGLILKNNVIFRSTDKKELRTENLRWRPKDRFIEVRDRFVLTEGGKIIQGKGFRSDIRFSEYAIQKRF